MKQICLILLFVVFISPCIFYNGAANGMLQQRKLVNRRPMKIGVNSDSEEENGRVGAKSNWKHVYNHYLDEKFHGLTELLCSRCFFNKFKVCFLLSSRL